MSQVAVALLERQLAEETSRRRAAAVEHRSALEALAQVTLEERAAEFAHAMPPGSAAILAETQLALS